MKISGRVVKIDGDRLHIVIDRSSACDLNCAKCGICSKKTVIQAKNETGAKHGDVVEVESKLFRMPIARRVIETKI